ncbi:MAG: hypothetical protein R2815_03260 [Flavobacteriales bacterium]|nr:hypothetical protein [Flavobacteriales bacterium]
MRKNVRAQAAKNHHFLCLTMMFRQLAVPLLITSLLSCGGAHEPTDSSAPGLVIGDGSASPTSSIYQMPTPNELFSLVRDMAGEGHKRLLNPTTNVDRYVSLKSRAMNFGIYSTDLVYASYFDLNVEVARYYLTTKKLAEGLGLSAAFTDADFLRLETNLTKGNSDSLESISSSSYMKAYERLQSEQKGTVLTMVLAGGWVESMHLVIRQIEAFGPSAPLMARVAEQKVTLEHLIQMMGEEAENEELNELHTKLLAIRDIYDQLNVQRVAHQGGSTSGRMVLGDDVTMELTPEKYQELVQAVDRLREEMVRPEDANA